MPPRAMRERTWYRPSTRRPIIGSACCSCSRFESTDGYLRATRSGSPRLTRSAARQRVGRQPSCDSQARALRSPTSRTRSGYAEICTACAACVNVMRLPARDVEQPAGAPAVRVGGAAVERAWPRARGRAPRSGVPQPGARALLEEAERVAVAVVGCAATTPASPWPARRRCPRSGTPSERPTSMIDAGVRRLSSVSGHARRADGRRHGRRIDERLAG